MSSSISHMGLFVEASRSPQQLQSTSRSTTSGLRVLPSGTWIWELRVVPGSPPSGKLNSTPSRGSRPTSNDRPNVVALHAQNHINKPATSNSSKHPQPQPQHSQLFLSIDFGPQIHTRVHRAKTLAAVVRSLPAPRHSWIGNLTLWDGRCLRILILV